MKLKPIAALSALSLLVVCGGGKDSVQGEIPNGLRTVTGSITNTYVSATGEGTRTLDLSLATVQACVPNGSGSYTFLTGTGHADGSFVISNVPQGSYFLLVKPDATSSTRGVWTSETSVNLGGVSQGRTDWTTATSPSTRLLTNYPTSAVRGVDQLVIPSLGTLLSVSNSSGGLHTWNWAGRPLPELGKDPITVTRLDDQTQPFGDILQKLTGIQQIPSLAMADGQESSLSPILGPISGITDNISVNIPRGVYIAYLADASPSGGMGGNLTLTLEAQPVSLAKGRLQGNPTLMSLRATQPNGTMVGNFSFMNPFPSQWAQCLSLTSGYSRTYKVASTGATIGFGAGCSVEVARGGSGTVDIAPFIGPPRNLRINGQSMYQDTFGVGMTPTLAWDAPSMGSPDQYDLSLIELASSGTSVQFISVASFRTSERSLILPTGLLTVGKTYVVFIWAEKSNGLDAKRPFQMGGLPRSYMPALSGTIQP